MFTSPWKAPRFSARPAGRLLLAALCFGLVSAVRAHDIPSDIVVRAFVKPEGRQLHVLLRFPLAALGDVEFPQRGSGYLDFARVAPWIQAAADQWMSQYSSFYEGDHDLGRPVIKAARISLPSDKSFRDYDTAFTHLTAEPPLPDDTELALNEALLDVLYEFPIQSDHSDFSVDPHLGRAGLKATSVIQFLPPGGPIRAFEFIGDPGGVVRLDPRWHQAALRFVHLGFVHILSGADHLLFLFCLIIPFRRIRSLIVVITAFTVAHSITLISSAFNLAPGALWFPPLIETLIATSIVYMALENIISPRLERRWLIAFGFGLVHGFGFSFALRETLQFAGSHLLTSLLSFNVGVELGQLFVLLLLVPALNLLFRFVVAERIGTIVLSALVTHTGWHWLIDRADRLRQFPLRWPEFSPSWLAGLNRWLILLVVVAGAGWVLYNLVSNTARQTGEKKPANASMRSR
jgi:hypothetical protein